MRPVLHWIGAFGFKEATRLATHGLVDAPIIVTPFDAADARLAVSADRWKEIAAALARGHGDFTDDTRPDLAPLFVLTTLAVLNICPFAVSGHERFLIPVSGLI